MTETIAYTAPDSKDPIAPAVEDNAFAARLAAKRAREEAEAAAAAAAATQTLGATDWNPVIEPEVPSEAPPEPVDQGPIRFEPLGDCVLVERVKDVAEKIGRIFVPDQAQEKPLEATVIAVGPGRRTESGDLIPTTVNVDDRVLIGKWSGTAVKIQGREFLVLKESEIFGRIPPADMANPVGSFGA